MEQQHPAQMEGQEGGYEEEEMVCCAFCFGRYCNCNRRFEFIVWTGLGLGGRLAFFIFFRLDGIGVRSGTMGVRALKRIELAHTPFGSQWVGWVGRRVLFPVTFVRSALHLFT